MVVKVLSKLEQTLSRLLAKPSLAGDSMLVRLRSGILGLLGLVVAVGLGLVALVAQQSWPGAFDSPLPATPEAPLVRNDTISLPPSDRRDPGAPAPDESQRRDRDSRARTPAAGTGLTSDLTGSRQVEEAPPSPAPPVDPDGADPPVPASPEQSPSTSPAPAPPPVQPPASESVSVPVAAGAGDAGADDDTPKRSGKPKGKSPSRPAKAPGPPPSAGQDDDEADDDYKDYGEDSYDDYDEGEYEDDDRGYGEYDGDRGRRGKRDWGGD